MERVPTQYLSGIRVSNYLQGTNAHGHSLCIEASRHWYRFVVRTSVKGSSSPHKPFYRRCTRGWRHGAHCYVSTPKPVKTKRKKYERSLCHSCTICSTSLWIMLTHSQWC